RMKDPRPSCWACGLWSSLAPGSSQPSSPFSSPLQSHIVAGPPGSIPASTSHPSTPSWIRC
ncbi:hypothetical protein D7B24_009106, partial [Verticillium nonalfalfae]